jgi:cobalt-zinc-cadmium efflux system protein
MTGKDRRWPLRAERQEPGHDHAHEPGTGRSHGLGTDADRRYLVIALCLMGAFMLGEVIVAFASGSLALLSDAGHMLSDVGAIAGRCAQSG